MVAEFQRRRNYCLMKLQAIPHVSCFKPQGAFYLFPNVQAYYDKEFNGAPIRNSYGLAYYLLKEAQVAIVPGDSFGADDYIRLSYATSMDNLEKGMDRIAQALAQLKTGEKSQTRRPSATPSRASKNPFPWMPRSRTRSGTAWWPRSRATCSATKTISNGTPTSTASSSSSGRTSPISMISGWRTGIPPSSNPTSSPTASSMPSTASPAASRGRSTTRTPKPASSSTADNYGPLRSLALGLVTDVSERLFGVHPVRGMSADAGGTGSILVGPPGTKKTELFFDLLRDPQFRFHSNDIVFVRHSGKTALADCVERKIYIPTNTVESFPRLAPLFDCSKCENVVTRKEDCTNAECLAPG